MSDRQILAEFGLGLCLAGLAPWAAPVVVPIAVLGAFLLDLRSKCDKRLARSSADRLLTMINNTPDLTNTDIKTARAWLDHRRADLKLDPMALAAAAKTGDLPDALYNLIVDDTLAKDGGARRAVRLALDAAYQTCRLQPTYHTIFTQEVLIDLAESHGLLQTKLDTILDQMAKNQAMLLQAIQSNQPQTFAAHTQMIIGLAQNYAQNPDGTPITDFDTAYRGFENALQVAENLRAQNALPRNAADQIDAVLAAVQALNDAAEFERADAALATARADATQRIAEQTSGLMRLWDSTVAQATLRNRPEQAAAALVERLMLDTPADRFAAMMALQNEWYECGRDKGLAFDLLVSIALAKASLTYAQTADQLGLGQNELGIALQTLGAREAGTALLEQAVVANREALKRWTRDQVPLKWAMTQMNLGNALATLGAREPGTAQLDAAVAAYTEALKEYTRDRVPLDWTLAQMNLSVTLRILGERDGGTVRLELAVAATAEALKECARHRAPLDWATLQMNLGCALGCLGAREAGTAKLEQAVAAFTEALKEYTRDRVPLDWAMTQMNLGNALQTIGTRETGSARLQQAVAAYTEALREYTRDRVPQDWALTQFNLANVEIAYFDKTADPAHLSRARAHVMAAREVFVQAGAGHYVGMTDRVLAKITARQT